MEKVLYKNERHEAATLQAFDWCLEQLQKLIDVYNGLQITVAEGTSLLYDLVHDPEGRVKTELQLKMWDTGNSPSYESIPVNPLIQQSKRCRQFTEFVRKTNAVFKLVDGKVTADPKAKKAIVEKQRIIAHTTQQSDF